MEPYLQLICLFLIFFFKSTVREATDRGFEPLIISDATMSYFERYRQQTIEQLVAQGALVAWSAESSTVVKALGKACGTQEQNLLLILCRFEMVDFDEIQ